MLLILCIQRAKHLWERLDWICDIATLVRTRPGINWEQVIEQASRLGCERILALGLYLAKKLLQAELPEAVWQRVQTDPMVEAIAAQVSQRFQQPDSFPRAYQRALFHLKTRERLRDRIEYCLRLAMTPTLTEWVLFPLPASFSFLYYLLRPLRLLKTHGLRPFKYLLYLRVVGVGNLE